LAGIFFGLEKPWPFIPAVIAPATITWTILWWIEWRDRRDGRRFSAYDAE